MTPRFDLSTGLELELLLPQGMNRVDLCVELANHFDTRLEIFSFPSKVPVPVLPSADAVVEMMESIAAHHEAMIHSVAEDGEYFYLVHRAGRLIAGDGAKVLEVVHDNTIAGGERVAELVTPPFFRDRLGWVRELVSSMPDGCVVPEAGALHVHVDGRPFYSPPALARLLELFGAFEPVLRAVLHTPAELRKAGPLPAGLARAVRACSSREELVRAIAERVRDRACGLNVYNLIGEDPAKITVELKLAGGTLDPARVVAIRELFVGLARWCVEENAPIPSVRDAASLFALAGCAI